MILYLEEIVRRLDVTREYFFRMVHRHYFTRDIDPHADIVKYEETGEPPPYVRRYIEEMQNAHVQVHEVRKGGYCESCGEVPLDIGYEVPHDARTLLDGAGMQGETP